MKPLVKVPLTNGVIAGTLSAVFLIVLYYSFTSHPLLVHPFLDFRIALLAIFMTFTLKEYKEVYGEGFLTFSHGMIVSFIFIGIFAIVSSAILAAFIGVVPEFVDSYTAQFIADHQNDSAEEIKQMGQENYDVYLRNGKSQTLASLSFGYFSQSFYIGLPISIIVSVFMRKVQPEEL
jgi:hypothetical protein